MANLTLFRSFNFKTEMSWDDWDLVGTPTSTKVTFGDATYRGVFTGNFTFPGPELLDGTASSFTLKSTSSGATIYTLSGFTVTVDASVVQGYISQPGNTQKAYAYILRANDTITGSSGIDVLLGYNGNDKLLGGGGSDKLYGGAGNDIINGGLGNDLLSGSTGSDKFIFNTTPNTSTNRDTITDFSTVYDQLQLENAVFTKLTQVGELAPGNFRANTAGKALDGNDFIVYETDTGKLFYDVDGNGVKAAVQFALIGTSTHAALAAADFNVS